MVPVGVTLRALPIRGVLGVVPVRVLVDSAKSYFLKVLHYRYRYLKSNEIVILHYKLQL